MEKNMSPLDKPSVRTFRDWIYELSDADYLDVLNGIYDADVIEIGKQELMHVKTLLGKGQECNDCEYYYDFYKAIKSLLEEWYRTDFYDDINYVW